LKKTLPLIIMTTLLLSTAVQASFLDDVLQFFGLSSEETLSLETQTQLVSTSGSNSLEVIQEDTILNTTLTFLNATYIELEISIRDEASPPGGYKWDMALCNIDGVDTLQYQNEDTGGGFDNAFPITVIEQKISDFGLPSSWCNETSGQGYVLFSSGGKNQLPEKIRLLLPEDFQEASVYYGDGTGILIFSANKGLSRPETPHFITTLNGIQHTVAKDDGNDFHYLNDTSGWENAASVQVSSSTTKTQMIFVNSSQHVVMMDMNGGHQRLQFFSMPDNESYFQAGDFDQVLLRTGTNNVLEYGEFDAVFDENDIMHVCITTAEWEDVTTNDFLQYFNHTPGDTDPHNDDYINLSIDATNDVDYCQIYRNETTGDMIIFGTGNDENDIDYWVSNATENFTTRRNFHTGGHEFIDVTSCESDGNTHIFVSSRQTANEALQFLNATLNDLSNPTFQTLIDGTTGTYSDISIQASPGCENIFITFKNETVGDDPGMFMNSTDLGATWTEPIQIVTSDVNTGPFMDTKTRYSANFWETGIMNFTYTNATGVYVDHITFNPIPGDAAVAISYTDPSDVDNAVVERNWTYINLSVTNTSTIDTVTLDWNGTNITIWGDGLVGLWNLDGDVTDL